MNSNGNVTISKICGLCAGCKFAVQTTLKKLQSGEKVTLFKEIVHNKNVNKMLQEQGVLFEENLDNLLSAEHVIIRAHGEPPETFEFLEKHGIAYTDCTCFNVKKIHEQIKHFSDLGYVIVIIGKYGKTTGVIHPEIAGSIGYSVSTPILIEDEDDTAKVENLTNQKVYVTCQTTFNLVQANLLISKIKQICEKNKNEVVVENSICSAQKMINKASSELAKNVDVMIVVGGKKSSNTKELFENVKQTTKSIFLEDISDWKTAFQENGITLSKIIKIGITAGASTMHSELEQLQDLLQNEISNLGETK
jgi:4-hydroxy-3-methylbut-2-enyl diphosphate reductase